MVLDGFPADKEHVMVRLLDAFLKLVPDVSRHRRDDGLGHIESGFELCRLRWLDLKLCDFEDHERFLKGKPNFDVVGNSPDMPGSRRITWR